MDQSQKLYNDTRLRLDLEELCRKHNFDSAILFTSRQGETFTKVYSDAGLPLVLFAVDGLIDTIIKRFPNVAQSLGLPVLPQVSLN